MSNRKNNKQSWMCFISAFVAFLFSFIDVLVAFHLRENCLRYKHSLDCSELHVQYKIDFPFTSFTKTLALLNFS